jgi:hypothetical protein
MEYSMISQGTKLTKAATVTLKHSRSCGLRSRIWMRIHVQTLVMIFMPWTPRCNLQLRTPVQGPEGAHP